MEFTETALPQGVLIAPSGRLDSNTAVDFEKQLLARLDSAPSLVLDLGDLEYVSSAGLRVILMAAKKIRQGQGRMLLCALRPHIREVFEISGFMAIFEVHPDRAAALAAFGA